MSVWMRFCLASNESTICTMEYAPVCWSKQVQCIKAPCYPVKYTYSNICMMNAEWAIFVGTGECKTNIFVGNEGDSHSCIWSRGYFWSQSKEACVGIWEYQASDLEKNYDFAFNNGITIKNSIKKFRANDNITRQEAAKMFVAMAENVLWMPIADLSIVRLIPYSDDINFDSSLRDFIYKARIYNIMQGSQGKFISQGNLTRGQSLAILMRVIDGWQDMEKTAQPRWMPYADRAHNLWYVSFVNFKWFDSPITRWELIKLIYVLSQKKISDKNQYVLLLNGTNTQSITVHHNYNQPTKILFTSDRATSIRVQISFPLQTWANLRRSQIILPNGTMDGPFGQDTSYSLTQSGWYQLIFGKNKMTGEPWSWTALIAITLQ